jgi:DNA-binding transcriptional MocR family regulator
VATNSDHNPCVPLRPPRVAEVVALHPPPRIIGGNLEDGAELPGEAELLEEFSASRLSVGEALRILEQRFSAGSGGAGCSWAESRKTDPWRYERRSRSFVNRRTGAPAEMWGEQSALKEAVLFSRDASEARERLASIEPPCGTEPEQRDAVSSHDLSARGVKCPA